MSRVTLRDIARETNVSHVTVSHVLRGSGACSEETRKAVVNAARRMGYRPNVAARAMNHGRFGVVGLVLSASERGRSTLPEDMLRGASEAVESRGMHLSVVTLTDERLADPQYVPVMLREWMCDGALLNYNKAVPARMVELIEYYRVPSVWLNHKRATDAVYPDDLSAGKDVVRRLIGLGHRRIAYFGLPDLDQNTHYSEFDRLDGYREAMREAKLDDFIVEYGLLDLPGAIEVLRQPNRPTAVVAYGVELLINVTQAMAVLGLHSPRDLSLITFSGQTTYMGFDIATALVPEERIGHLGVDMLQKKINASQADIPAEPVAFDFHKGQSIGPPLPQ